MVRKPPTLDSLLKIAAAEGKPIALVLAGHNGSGKSTLWYDRLADGLQIPLVNADRLTLSLLPPVDEDQKLKQWAERLRDGDERWQKLSQDGVQLFMGLIMDQGMSFAFETVFSYLEQQPDGSFKSKTDTITTLQEHGYFVILLFVGLASAELSILRVATRKMHGGHSVPDAKLKSRYPRTQQAIRIASEVADMTLMFDNSRSLKHAFSLVRAQRKTAVLFDCRDVKFRSDGGLLKVAELWLSKVAAP
ncbi:zeta toxin family protein [Granulicella mallensis]|uniref:Zeta toxin family protein n=1 Tax=Granulicella mallensis (strain ATCC BAA-1857 / DSM 23137 / MP5ACTX8) TaxID=682795 RepID=G8NSI7_GRAMM|nr:zeta toxin family protein [Granulicella mallensis]AEU38563.1 Zeta toxin family protein [Granulicella mallensis MP5ACTX8]